MSLKVQTLESGDGGVKAAAMHAGQDMRIKSENLDLVDWQRVYLELLEYKERKGFTNLAVRPETSRMIMETSEPVRLYSLIADESVVAPRSFAETALLHEATMSILRKYTDSFYRVRQERWDSEHMVYKEGDEEDASFRDYTVRIARGEAELIGAIRTLIEEADRIYREDTEELPGIHFDRHLYQPLLVERDDRIRSEPPGLNDGERRLV